MANVGQSTAESGTAGSSGEAGTAGTGNSRGRGGKHPGNGEGNGNGPGKEGGSKDQINWYLAMIQDRFYSRWQRPVLGEQLSTVVKIRIQKDGHISAVSLEKSSGNAIMDESAMTAAKSVPQIDPLPAAIQDSFYDVPIEFKLTSD